MTEYSDTHDLQGDTLLDAGSKTTRVLAEEFEYYCSDIWSSKAALLLIRRKNAATTVDGQTQDGRACSSTTALQRAPLLAEYVCCSKGWLSWH